MPTVRTGDIRGAYVGEREAGAMLMGDKIIWNRTAMYTRTNNSAPAVPDWATFFTAILVGGGAGGQAGNGGVGSQGSGGRSGDVRFVSDSIHPGSGLSLVIGKGGSGGRSASLEYGRSGTSTTLSYRKYGSSSRSSTSAAGGSGITGNPTAGSPYITSGQGGRYYSSHRGGTSTLTIGSGGEGNAGTGTNGGGGAGGNGGFFNNYTPGGRGGDGWFQIQFYGVDPLAYQAHTQGGTTAAPPDPGVSGSDGPAEENNRGGFELGVTYRKGDIVTIGRGEYPAAAAEGTYRALVTHESSFYHYPWNDPRTWERID